MIELNTTNGKRIQIDEKNEIYRGGEGKIFPHPYNDNLVIKIYHDNAQPIEEDKFNYLSQLSTKYFVIPQEIVYDEKNNVVGYVMEYLGNSFFPISTIFSKKFCSRNGITEDVKKKICYSLIEIINYAHKNEIIIGDFNQFNIMINKKGDVKLIDVDSCQTPNHPHSGVLLNEIRDHLKGGKVNKESDYFALSVMIFNLLTFTHPFKGIHFKYKKIADRMIHKLPVFVNDSDLKVPKCYSPLSDDNLQNQFEKLYLDGERFLLSLNQAQVTVKRPNIQSPSKIEEKDLYIKTIAENENIVNVKFSENYGVIETKEKIILYNAQNKGYLVKLGTVFKKDYENIYLGKENIVLKSGNSLYQFFDEGNIQKLTGVQFSREPLIYQLENIVIKIENNTMTWIYLDQIKGNHILSEKTPVFEKGFRFFQGLVQTSGGINRIFYNTGKNIATVKLNYNIKSLYQNKNTGIIQYIDNGKIINKFFKIDGFDVQFSSDNLPSLSDFAYRKKDEKNGTIFYPSDGMIDIYRTQDFSCLSQMECSVISEQTVLNNSKCGIVAWEDNNVYLLNKK